MAILSLCAVFSQFLFIIIIIPVLKVTSEVAAAASHSPVKLLPGFEGPLPFQMETG